VAGEAAPGQRREGKGVVDGQARPVGGRAGSTGITGGIGCIGRTVAVRQSIEAAELREPCLVLVSRTGGRSGSA
jgi:hypothetical protein